MIESPDTNPKVIPAELPYALSMNRLRLWWLLFTVKRRKATSAKNRRLPFEQIQVLKFRRPKHSAGWKQLASSEVTEIIDPDVLIRPVRSTFVQKGIRITALRDIAICEGFDAGGAFTYLMVTVILT